MGLRLNIEKEMHPGPWAWAQDRAGPMHFLLNIRSQVHPNPSTSSLPAPGGRASGLLSSKKEKGMRELIKDLIGHLDFKPC